MKFKHEESHVGGIGKISIEGFIIPKGEINYDVLAKIYSSIRKRWNEEQGLDVVGIFIQTAEGGTQGSFYLNYGVPKTANIRLLRNKFGETFESLAKRVYEAIDLFLQDEEDGCKWYVGYIQQNNASYAVCDKRIERFLKKKGLKKDDDDKKENYHPLLRPR